MSALRALILAMVCIAASPLAAKQVATTSADRDRLEDRTAIARFGDCIVGHSPADAAQALRANYTFDQTVAAYPGLIAPDCAALWVSERPLDERAYMVQFAIADSLVRAENAQVASDALEGQPALSHRIFGPRRDLDAALAKMGSDKLRNIVEEAAAVTTRFGECVVRQDPAGARNLLATAPESAEEQAAFEALQKANNACASQIAAGKPCGLNCREWFIDFTRVSYRGGIAVSYYRLAHGAPATNGERTDA